MKERRVGQGGKKTTLQTPKCTDTKVQTPNYKSTKDINEARLPQHTPQNSIYGWRAVTITALNQHKSSSMKLK